MSGGGERGVSEWTVEDVSVWLVERGFTTYCDVLCRQHQIDGTALLLLTESDLREEPIKIPVVGDIKRLMLHILRLQQDNTVDRLVPYGAPRGVSRSPRPSPRHARKQPSPSPDSVRTRRELRPEKLKLVVAFLYSSIVLLLTSLVMVIVHDRVPSKDKYPPLPDLILDNVPLMPWAFHLCELTGLLLAAVFITVCVFHKHRCIILRRLFSLTGTIFLLRCVSMLITSLSVPGSHLDCKPLVEDATDDTWQDQLHRAFVIWSGMGMSLNGVRTCGDYMFSGHTVLLTLCNFFITEYTPHSLAAVHTAAWCLNLFGIFFILAAHEHYSIDVFIAFYITSRLFLSYHMLSASSSPIHRHTQRKARTWFPLFSYFEANVDGMVPHEFEWPLPWPQAAVRVFQSTQSSNKSHQMWAGEEPAPNDKIKSA